MINMSSLNWTSGFRLRISTRQLLEVTGPEAITCTQLAEIFSSLLHTPVHYATISDEETEKALLGRYSPWRARAVVTLLQFPSASNDHDWLREAAPVSPVLPALRVPRWNDVI